MAQNDLDLAALVSSRICHDLISPIGAINNGLELLNMSGATPVGPEMQLIYDSVKSASARIRFFRIAFGTASDDPVVRNEVTSILTEMFNGGRLDGERVEERPVSRARQAERPHFDGTASSDVLDATACGGGGGGGDGGGGIALSFVRLTLA